LAGKNKSKKDIKHEEPLAEQEENRKKQDAEEITKKKKNKLSKKGRKAPEQVIEGLQAELVTEKDRTLRLSAEFENFKKRSTREIEDFRKFANESLFKRLLTVMDNLERAINSGEGSDPGDSILEGVQLTHKEMMKFFETFNVKPIEAAGKPFDPAFHQAVTQQESDEHPENTVVMELQKGYLLHDRLIRPSMVVVSKAITEKEKKK